MHVKIFPADVFGCGHFRLIWATRELIKQGADIDLVPPGDRRLEMRVTDETVTDVVWGDDRPDVVVFQRVTHRFLAQAIPIIRAQGIAVVIDIDDDLSSIHPANPAYNAMHPQNEYLREPGRVLRHSWRHLSAACREATLVTVSTPGLLQRYAAHGRGRVIYNHLPGFYFDIGDGHVDSDLIGWPAALTSHPDDPSATGGALARLTGAGAAFQVIGDPSGVAQAFGLSEPVSGMQGLDVNDWPKGVVQLGVGIAPLEDTRFNACKSWLKPLEMAALGVPCVMSPRAEYSRLNAKGVGLLADRPRTWYRAVKSLWESAELRAEVAGRGRLAAQQYRLEDHVDQWWSAWVDARRVQDQQSSLLIA